MSGSENGGNGNKEQAAVSSPGKAVGGRSASPAKRSAADMEGAGGAAGGEAGQQTQQAPPGSFPPEQNEKPSLFDEVMTGMTPASNDVDTQETVANSAATSAPSTLSVNTSATSLQSEELPSYAEANGLHDATDYTTEELDKQHAQVLEAASKTPDLGEKGIVVSTAWLGRVLSRTSQGLKSNDFPKEAREGPIGPVDNSSIVPDGAFTGSHLSDGHSGDFIPLKPGLQLGTDFEILPSSVWGYVVSMYGMVQGQHQINRYAKDTAPPGSTQSNIQFDINPPIFTIRKVPQPGQQEERSVQSSSLDALRLKKEKEKDMLARGQTSPDDAVKLVAARSDRFQSFLARAKEAAGIPRTTKVKVWRLLNPQNVAVDQADGKPASVVSSPPSRSTSPSKAPGTAGAKLILPSPEFKEMEIGPQLEHVDVKDETSNDKYNGKSTLETHGLFEAQTILLEEQIGGPAGGEFQSDGKKPSTKLTLPKRNGGSKPGSTTASGRTSPTPGMMTRGRTRRDGRTRGTVGLSNLGNTCYMNSALQCIRSVEELALYFLSGTYKREINANNPLGHGGVMAKQYSGVLDGIYGSSSSNSFSPNNFKRTLGTLQPLFSGYGQQDSQEFLSFLVDALHEDLNRIEKKPYNENPDSDDATVHDPQAIIELGETYRRNHRARNDSVCMDLFSGFYKNTMECPVCDKVSVTFDPYSLVTVQLPVENTFQHSITFVPLRGAPINHAIDMDKNATIKALKESIASKHPGVTADHLWMIEVYNHKIYKVFENQHTIVEDNIQTNDHIFVFELEGAPTNIPEPSKKKAFYNYNTADKEVPEMDSPKADRFAVPVFSRQKNRFGNGWDIMMHPLYVTLTRDEAQDFEIILKKVLIAVAQQTSRPILTEASEGQEDGDDEPTVVGDAEKDESAGEDAARVSDRSVPSEDGYVEVSVGKQKQDAETEEMADATDEAQRTINPVPKRFMGSEYFISPALRNQLFALNYAKSSEGMLCASMSSIEERSVRNMFDRVKQPARRASTSEESSTSAASGQADGESEESDADDDEDRPDIVLGGGPEDPMHLSTPTSAQPDSDDELPDDPLTPLTDFKRGYARRGQGKPNKFAGNRKKKPKQKTYGKKDRKNKGQRRGSSNSLRSTQSQRSLGGKALQSDDDDPYYIKLGEAIVLNWYPEGLDSLFGGDSQDEGELRGHWLSSSDGRGLDYVPDPVLEEKKKTRAARRKNGISLEDCFVETGKREILSEDNAWYCNRCKEMRQAAKTLEIWTIPDILIVHLKRFGGNRSFRDKIDVMVDYPIEGLDMTQRIGLKEDGKEYTYDLFAVDNHYGGLGGGHYTAMAKNFYDGQWYDYNDSSVSKLGDAKLHSAAAYLLFYRRRSDKPLGPQYLQELVSEAHNPTEAETAGDEAEEGESGEGRLGGPTSSLRGSPSALVGAGVGTNGITHNTTANGSAGAGNSLKTKMTGQSSGGGDEEPSSPLGILNGKPIAGPPRPPHMQAYGPQSTPTWGFSALDQQPTEADGNATEMLLDNMQRDHDDDDKVSLMAGLDSGFGEEISQRDRLEEDFGPYASGGDYRSGAWPGTPIGSNEIDDGNGGWQDHHNMYSSGHEDFDGILHLEDAGGMGGEGDSPSPPAAEIRVGGDDGDEAMEGVTHDKAE